MPGGGIRQQRIRLAESVRPKAYALVPRKILRCPPARTSTLCSITLATLEAPSRATLKTVPSACTSPSALTTMKGRLASGATRAYTPPLRRRTRRAPALKSRSTADRAFSVNSLPSGKV